MFEKTLQTFFSFEGIGLHTGQPVTLTVYPQTCEGIRFRRSDIPFSAVIPAHYDFVMNTRMSTIIGTSEKNTVSTIEHFMGALYMADIDHALIEIDGPELPLADGSARLFLEAIDEAGLMDLETKRKTLAVKRNIAFENETARVELHPCDTFKISQHIDFAHEPTIGKQEHTVSVDDFIKDVSGARTFGNIADHEKLKAMGLAQGATLHNLLVYDNEKVLSPGGLRFQNEVVRHKVLDSIGDLFTCGYRLQAHFITHKGGHFHNNEILKVLFSDPENFEIV